MTPPLKVAVTGGSLGGLTVALLLPLALLALLSPAAAFRASLRWAPCGSAWGAGVASRRAAGPPAPARGRSLCGRAPRNPPSNEARLPAELKHITKRRRRN